MFNTFFFFNLVQLFFKKFMINPKNRQVSHFVMREGHLWGKKDVTIPIAEVARFSDDIVYLKLDKAGIEALPSVPLRR